jgi:hypothetical protein
LEYERQIMSVLRYELRSKQALKRARRPSRKRGEQAAGEGLTRKTEAKPEEQRIIPKAEIQTTNEGN